MNGSCICPAMFCGCCCGTTDDDNAKTIGTLDPVDKYATAEGWPFTEEESEVTGLEPEASSASTASADFSQLARFQAPKLRTKFLPQSSLSSINEHEDMTSKEVVGANALLVPAQTFLLTLTKGAADVDSAWPFGVSLFFSDVVDHLEIVDVDETNESVKAYNAGVEPHCRAKPGQLILAVNGETDDVACMLAAWRASEQVICVTCWPMEFTIQLEKGLDGFGVDVTHSKKGVTLLIESITPGSIQRWNRMNPDRAVKVADRIVAVNGTRGSPEELKSALRLGSGMLHVVIARRP